LLDLLGPPDGEVAAGADFFLAISVCGGDRAGWGDGAGAARATGSVWRRPDRDSTAVGSSPQPPDRPSSTFNRKRNRRRQTLMSFRAAPARRSEQGIMTPPNLDVVSRGARTPERTRDNDRAARCVFHNLVIMRKTAHLLQCGRTEDDP
jgi:hypothetical protein